MPRGNTLCAALVWLCLIGDPVTAAHDPVIVHDLARTSVRARLVAARISETRGRYLIAKFRTEEEEPHEVIFTFPAHSLTTHEATLSSIIRACCRGYSEGGWGMAQVEAEFSIPDAATLRLLDRDARLERCSLVKLGLTKGE